jgi:CubicO group peptidase (beta-lactamase class C family)
MLRWSIRFIAYLFCTVLLLMLVAYLTGFGYLIRGVKASYLKGYTSANIYDAGDFDTRNVANSKDISSLPRSTSYNKIPIPKALEDMLKRTNSTSFLVIKNDSIVWEQYYKDHTDTTRSNSFSMAKTITTMLVQCAIADGKIKSWDARVKDYLPWLEGPFADQVTMRHLSTMMAGLDWPESYYDPFGITARAYYGNDVEKTMKKVKAVSKPGVEYHYQSGATQLLGFCLKKAIDEPIASYASRKLWVPIGAEMSAAWHLDDEDGTELTYCCFNAITRDFGRLGQMVLHHGRYGNQQLVDSAFLEYAATSKQVDWYGQSFWLGKSQGHAFRMMQGTMGQFIIAIPGADMVIVRTGHKYLQARNGIHECCQLYVDESVKTFSTK